MQQRQQGFTLVEMAIVMVIIGLVSGGVLVGANMIRSAEVQSVGEDFIKYEAAVKNFHDHYLALPGDYARATDQWGILAGTGNDSVCQDTEAIDTKATCNGDDNGWIEEYYRAWQHLANADMLTGTYTGRAAQAGTDHAIAGKNAPGSRAGGVYRIAVIYINMVDLDWFALPSGHYIDLRDKPYDTQMPLTPAEAFMIDHKFDDGKPGAGRIQSMRQSAMTSPNCTSSDNGTAAEYNATNINKICPLRFHMYLGQ